MIKYICVHEWTDYLSFGSNLDFEFDNITKKLQSIILVLSFGKMEFWIQWERKND